MPAIDPPFYDNELLILGLNALL